MLIFLLSVIGSYPEEVNADSGYSSEKNSIYLKEKNIRSFIKLQTHEKMKTRAYKEDIGKYYNMMYMIKGDSHYYWCHGGRRLNYIRTEIGAGIRLRKRMLMPEGFLCFCTQNSDKFKNQLT